MKRLITILLVVFMSLSVFTGCGNTSSTVKSTSTNQDTDEANTKTTFGLAPFKQQQTLRIGFFTGSALSYPYLFADKENFFKELNIKIVLVPFTNGPAMMEASSEWDIASCGLGGLCTAMKGYGLKVFDINDYEQNIGLFVRPGSALAKDPSNPKNWKGTKWIYPAGTTGQATLVTALKKVGLTLKDITSTNMDVANALTGFKGGTGDGLVVWNAIAFNAEDAGYVRIGDAGTLGFKAPCGTVATPQTIEANRKLIETVVAVFHFTSEWLHKSDANMKKADAWYLEDCNNEGVKVNASTAKRVMDKYKGPSMAQYINLFTAKSPDDAKLYTKRNLLQAEKDILVGFDFFVSQGNYSVADRTNILDKQLIDPSIALGVKTMLIKRKISIDK